MSTNPTPTPRQQAAQGLSSILAAALEHVPPATRELLAQAARPLLAQLAEADRPAPTETAPPKPRK
jgi:hypothetical protein